MAAYQSYERRYLGATPPTPPGDEAYGGRKRIFRSTIALDAPILTPTSTGTQITTADTVALARIPAGMRFVSGRITSSISLSTAVVAIGIVGTLGKYRTGAVFTAVDTPTAFGNAAAMAAGPLGADEEVILSVATANVPNTAGAKLIIDLEFAAP